MILPSTRIERNASPKKSLRPALESMYLEIEGEVARLYATDSYQAVEIEVAANAGDVSEPIPHEAVALARTWKGATISVLEREVVVEAEGKRAEFKRTQVAPWPNVSGVFKAARETTATEVVRLSPDKLIRALRPFGTQYVDLHITPAGELKPLRIVGTKDAMEALLMPVRRAGFE